MDPYLERRDRWPAVHTRLIVAMADALGPQVRPRYRVDIELRTYIAFVTSESLVGIPDVLVMAAPQHADSPLPAATYGGVAPQVVEVPMPTEILERYLVVRDVATQEVITVIELLSLANKLTNEGRADYDEKRRRILASRTNLVEIDLLRAGAPLPPFQAGQSDYRILLSPAYSRPRAMAYLFGVRQPIPTITVALRPGEPEPSLPLNQLLHDVYDRGSYDLAIDYAHPPEPPLSDEDMDWARRLFA
jgi:hypothetical protein